MKSPKFIVLMLSFSLLFTSACSSALESRSEPANLAQTQTASDVPQTKKNESEQSPMQRVSLQQADQSQSVAEAFNRKIVRNADLTVEVSAPLSAQQQITSIAESLGGFVVNSESKSRQSDDATKRSLDISIVMRVPEQRFQSALEQIIGVGSRVIQQKVSGEDVTEQFIDLEARAKTQKALEQQFLEIMKRAVKVEDALEVQRQVAEVRTEIEKLEGRKRFLENRASLSTITVTLQEPTAVVVNTSGFGRNVREAVSESVTLAVGIVMFVVRFVIVMMPILVLIIVPGLLLTRFVLRRARKMQLDREPEAAAPNSAVL